MSIIEDLLPYMHWHEDHWDACKHNSEVAILVKAFESLLPKLASVVANYEDGVDQCSACGGVIHCGAFCQHCGAKLIWEESE